MNRKLILAALSSIVVALPLAARADAGVDESLLPKARPYQSNQQDSGYAQKGRLADPFEPGQRAP